MDSLKFYPGPPCPTLYALRAVSRVAHPQGGWPSAVWYPFGQPQAYVNPPDPGIPLQRRGRSDGAGVVVRDAVSQDDDEGVEESRQTAAAVPGCGGMNKLRVNSMIRGTMFKNNITN
jgi:hypothetical protein